VSYIRRKAVAYEQKRQISFDNETRARIDAVATCLRDLVAEIEREEHWK
jgi:hypothetical protein